MDLDLDACRRVALVGPSGAGKSTVAALLLRFCDLAGGSATLGGADLATYDPDAVRTVITGCAQDPHLFDTTIAANIRLARPRPARTSWRRPRAGAPAALDRLVPQGWDTPVGARGPPSQAASGSGSRWPGRCWPTRRC